MQVVIKILLALIFFIYGDSRAESYLVEVKREDIWEEDVLQNEKVFSMLKEGLTVLTGKTNLSQALATWINPKDVVGIKISTQGGRGLSSKPILVNGLIVGLKALGVSGKNIIVWDKEATSMEQAGYLLGQRGDGVRYEAVIPFTGFDSNVFVTQPQVGELIWGDLEFHGETGLTKRSAKVSKQQDWKKSLNFEIASRSSPLARQESIRSYMAWLVTRRITKLIHVPVLVNSETVGIYGCISDLVLGSIDNSRRFQEEPMWGDPALAEVYATTVLAQKTILHVMDGLEMQFAGGPSYAPRYCRKGNLLFLSTDPVALDSYAAEILEAWRSAGRLPSLKAHINYLKTANELGLGNWHNEDSVKFTKVVINPNEKIP